MFSVKRDEIKGRPASPSLPPSFFLLFVNVRTRITVEHVKFTGFHNFIAATTPIEFISHNRKQIHENVFEEGERERKGGRY